MTKRHPWSIHNCATDPECRTLGGIPRRIYFHTPRGSLIVALDRDSSTQVWLPHLGYTHWWSPVVWHPASKS